MIISNLSKNGVNWFFLSATKNNNDQTFKAIGFDSQ